MHRQTPILAVAGGSENSRGWKLVRLIAADPHVAIGYASAKKTAVSGGFCGFPRANFTCNRPNAQVPFTSRPLCAAFKRVAAAPSRCFADLVGRSIRRAQMAKKKQAPKKAVKKKAVKKAAAKKAVKKAKAKKVVAKKGVKKKAVKKAAAKKTVKKQSPAKKAAPAKAAKPKKKAARKAPARMRPRPAPAATPASQPETPPVESAAVVAPTPQPAPEPVVSQVPEPVFGESAPAERQFAAVTAPTENGDHMG
jgi:hypothetical protein